MDRSQPVWQSAAEVVRDAGGRIVGRTKLQKVAYFLELAGLGVGFQFEYRHYGPYSEDLAGAIQLANAFDLVVEEEKQAEWGGRYSIYTATDQAGVRTAGLRAEFAERAAQIDAIELELAATAAYLYLVDGSIAPWDETIRLKPEKATIVRIEGAKKAYRELQQLRVPQPLPMI